MEVIRLVNIAFVEKNLYRNLVLILIATVAMMPSQGITHDLGDGAHLTTIVTSLPERSIDLRWNIEITIQELLGEFPHSDSDENGRLTPLEYAHIDAQKVAKYVTERIAVLSKDHRCHLSITAYNIVTHKRADYMQFPLTVDCSGAYQKLTVDYHLFFDENPYHQGTWTIIYDGKPSLYYFWEDQRRHSHWFQKPSLWSVSLDFLGKGIHHILIGYDHLLFLFSLLLTAVLVRKGRQWRPVAGFSDAFVNVIKLITVFTIAHSITLTCAVLEWVWVPPSRWVESFIALTVLLAALNILFPIRQSAVLAVTFVFGLIHGFGFASVLQEYEMSEDSLLVGLLSFNGGVEIGQIAVVAMLLPLLFGLRGKQVYVTHILKGAAFMIGTIAFLWLIDRSFNLQLGV
ncbi:MAG: HupE/UreJ family protein [Pseudomonadales bacterium]|nr:HupE/UreJ family protein [Pseudomonadales bacterium]